MSWKEKCSLELMRRELFFSIVQMDRFKKVFELVKDRPYFTKGVYKCLFLIAWDPLKVANIERLFQEMDQRKEKDTTYLIQESDCLFQSTSLEQTMKLLFLKFLVEEGETPNEDILVGLSVSMVAIADNALKVSRLLDQLS